MQSYRPTYQQQPQRSPLQNTSRRGPGPMLGSGHQQQSMTPAQMQVQQEAQRNALDQAKRRSRKPTDKNIPEGVEEDIIGDGVQRYRELRDVERRLDSTMMRKRLDIQNVRDGNVKRYRTLRVWISNTVEEQPWQAESLDVDAFDFSTNMDSSFKVKIEGRLLEDEIDDNMSDDSEDEEDINADSMDEDKKPKSKVNQKYRFSHFFKSMTVDFERSRAKDGTEHSVEWKKPNVAPNAINTPAAADFDQLEFKRGGDENINITINLVRDESPERYALSPVLAEVMDSTEATRAEAVTGIWEYIKVMGLQEDDEKRSFRCDDLLRQIFARDTGYIPYIPDAILPHMTPLPPLKLAYTIRCDQAFHANNPLPTIYDISVTLPSPLASSLHHFTASPTLPATLREISSLNDTLSLIVARLGESKAKHTFLTALSKDPATFVRKWMSSQKRDLDVVTGESMRGGEDAQSEEFRRGGEEGVWGSELVRESVNLLLASRPAR